MLQAKSLEALAKFPNMCFRWWCDHRLTVWSHNETKLKWTILIGK